MTLVLAYGALVLALACLVALRRGTTLLRGGGLLTFHLVVIAVALASSLLGLVRSDPVALAVLAVPALASLAGRRNWWLLRDDPERSRRVLAESLERVLARHEPAPDGFVMTSRAGPIPIRLTAPAPGLGRLCFEAPQPTAKLALLRDLVGKQFHPTLPRLRIRLK